MGRFDTIINNFIQWGNSTEKLYVAMIIGSQARKDHPADDFSDLDIIMVVNEPDYFLQSNDWLEQIGNLHISFIEDTIGGGRERRVLFDNALDVDFVILSRENFDDAIKGGESEILKRGYLVLIDKIGVQSLLPSAAAEKPSYILMTEYKFDNMTNDFWYHAVWTAKKLIRGELWTAKACVDNYMKQQLLTLIECHAHALNGMDYDSWHSGRFLEEWAERWVIQKLSDCYAHYERNDIKNALLSTMDLFRQIAVEVADKLNYEYPTTADEFSTAWVIKALPD